MIFVFGSNIAGRHGAGAAKFARENHGAVYGFGVGHHGNSYAIPTKDRYIRPLPLATISGFVADFLTYARTRSDLQFEVTKIGCGLAGYQEQDIAPMFRDAPTNCVLPEGWREFADLQL